MNISAMENNNHAFKGYLVWCLLSWEVSVVCHKFHANTRTNQCDGRTSESVEVEYLIMTLIFIEKFMKIQCHLTRNLLIYASLLEK
jgi:hypothetical protein